MALQGTSVPVLEAVIPTVQTDFQTIMTQSKMPSMLLQVITLLHAMDLAHSAVQQKCEADAVSLQEERKRRAADRALCEEREEKLVNELLEQRKLFYGVSEDKRWVEELMTETEKRYLASQAEWQLELETCKENEKKAMENIQILENQLQNVTRQLSKCNDNEETTKCHAEKDAAIQERNEMEAAFKAFGLDAMNQVLLKVAREGNARAIRVLVQCGATVNVQDSSSNYRRTPLHWGAAEGQVEVMKTLIDLGANPSRDVDSDRYTLLHSAARYGRSDAVRFLLAGKWIPVDARVPGNLETPLHLASRHGHSGVIEILLAAGASIDTGNYKKSTPLHMAAFNGRKQAVFILINHGASLILRDHDGNAYENAIEGGHRDIAEFIRSRM